MTLQVNDTIPHDLGAKTRSDARHRIFYFMRTGDCAVCRTHVKRLVELAPTMARLGAEVTIFVPDEAAPAWARDLPYPLVAGKDAYLAAGFGRTLGAVQQSGTIVADGGGRIVHVRRATLPFQAFHERELLALLRGPDLAAVA